MRGNERPHHSLAPPLPHADMRHEGMHEQHSHKGWCVGPTIPVLGAGAKARVKTGYYSSLACSHNELLRICSIGSDQVPRCLAPRTTWVPCLVMNAAAAAAAAAV